MKTARPRLRGHSRPALLATIVALVSLSGLGAPHSAIADDSSAPPLAPGFANPPATARPQTWWHWLNGNVTHAGITADLEAMKRIGIGGAEIFNVDQGIPLGKAPFLSPQWFDMVHFAASEAHRLGLELTIHNCAGWSSSGGPWITPQYAMQQVVTSATAVSGGAHFSGKLSQPPMHNDFYRDIAVIAVPAPPPGSPEQIGIADLRTKADYDRGDNIGPATTGAAPANTYVARSAEIDLTAQMASDGTLTWDAPAGNWQVLRIGYTPTGAQNEPSPAAGLGLECDKLSRAALDVHFAGMVQKVLDNTGPLAGKGKAFDDILIDSYEVGSQNWTPAFRDEFRKRRGYDLLPYLPVLAGRVVENPAVSERFLWDFRRTITDLFTENYYGHFAELCHQRGLKFSCEAYGNGPFDELACGGRADVPMAEFWIGGGAIETAKLASSSAHTYGRAYAGAESFTSDPSHARWTNDPYDLKALGDQMYCDGINRFIFHRYAMQPWTDRAPGMTMGPWGLHFERTNTWWNQGAAWISYLTRCQYLLQSGSFVADALYYEGDNAPISMQRGNPPLPAGYDYDGLSRELLLNQLSVKNGLLTLPSGMEYRVLVLPPSETLTVETLRKIRQLVYDGATVVGQRPLRSPSLQDYPRCDTKLNSLADDLWGTAGGAIDRTVGKGRVLWGDPATVVAHAFADLNVAPDLLVLRPDRRTNGVRYIHRTDRGSDIYFISSGWSQTRDIEVSIRRDAPSKPYLYNPNSGKIEPLPIYTEGVGRVRIPLHLDPSGSVFVVFQAGAADADHPIRIARVSGSGPVAPPAPVLTIQHAIYEAVDGTPGSLDATARVQAAVEEGTLLMDVSNASLGGDPANLHVKQLRVQYTLNGKPGEITAGENGMLEIADPRQHNAFPDYQVQRDAAGAVSLEAWKAGDFALATESGHSETVHVAAVADPIAVEGPWTLQFPPNLGAPTLPLTFPELTSWTDSADTGVRYFSGTAAYTRTIEIPADRLGAGKRLYLDLGQVKNLAEVRVNGVDFGVLWKPPFRVDISSALHAGTNSVSIEITNLWPNRLIGDAQLPDDADWEGDHLRSWPQWLLDDKPSPTGHIAFATWKHWHKDDKPLPSGLLGPVQLLSSVTVPVP